MRLAPSSIDLTELRNVCLHTILVWSLFYSKQVYTSLYFLPILLENQFFCLSEFFVFLFFACSEFDIIFMHFGNICIVIIYIIGVKYSVFLFSLITFQLHNLRKQNTSCLQGVLKIPFIKKNVEQQIF